MLAEARGNPLTLLVLPRSVGPDLDEPQAHDPYLPWIETPRCSTCNEWTAINDRMFVDDENRQAFIADPDAGTYAELVLAAENCQVAIIHPGKPRNPAEPGLDELTRRAEAFARGGPRGHRLRDDTFGPDATGPHPDRDGRTTP